MSQVLQPLLGEGRAVAQAVVEGRAQRPDVAARVGRRGVPRLLRADELRGPEDMPLDRRRHTEAAHLHLLIVASQVVDRAVGTPEDEAVAGVEGREVVGHGQGQQTLEVHGLHDPRRAGREESGEVGEDAVEALGRQVAAGVLGPHRLAGRPEGRKEDENIQEEILSAVERAVVLAKAKGAKRAVLLPVSAPFHCALMQPAADAMATALADAAIATAIMAV